MAARKNPTVPQTADGQPEHGQKAQAVYDAVAPLVKDGMKPTEAFAVVAEQLNMNAGTVATSYYRTNRKQNPGAASASNTGRKRAQAAASTNSRGRTLLQVPADAQALMEAYTTASGHVSTAMRAQEEALAKLLDYHVQAEEAHAAREEAVQQLEENTAALREVLAKFAPAQ